MKKTSWFYGGLFLVGVVLLGIAVVPFVQGWWSSFWEGQQQALTPLPLDSWLRKVDEGPKIISDLASVQVAQEPVIVSELPTDFSRIENWFGSKSVSIAETTMESYTIEIPKVEIDNALVRIGGNNIENNLVHFNPEAKIGGLGAPVIFGHSTLRQFYNPKESNKDRYKSIFSTIMTLNIGDEIRINTGTISYVYTVVEKKEVQPDDDYILAQDLGARQIKLVTCVPEGTFLRRGVITAELKL